MRWQRIAYFPERRTDDVYRLSPDRPSVGHICSVEDRLGERFILDTDQAGAGPDNRINAAGLLESRSYRRLERSANAGRPSADLSALDGRPARPEPELAHPDAASLPRSE